MIQFDEYGYVTPYNVVELEMGTFENVFVTNLHRRMLFNEYLAYSESLKKLDLGNFFQWVDGSFVGRSKDNPDDIDLVNFLDYNVFRSKEKELNALRDTFPRIDSYKSPVYPDDHKYYSNFNSERIHWLHFFTRTRPNRHTKKRFHKGVIQLNF